MEYKYWVAEQKPARKEVIHTVKSGESLESLMTKYHCSEQDIKAWNILTNIRIRPGKKIVMFQLLQEPDEFKSSSSSNIIPNTTNEIFKPTKQVPINCVGSAKNLAIIFPDRPPCFFLSSKLKRFALTNPISYPEKNPMSASEAIIANNITN